MTPGPRAGDVGEPPLPERRGYASLPPAPEVRHPWVDYSLSPLMIVHWPETSSAKDIEGLMACADEWTAKLGETYWAGIMNMSAFDASHSTAEKRKLFIEGVRRNYDLAAPYIVALAMVTPNPLIRGVTTAVLWFVTPPCETKTFADLDTAKAWAAEKLAEHARSLEG